MSSYFKTLICFFIFIVATLQAKSQPFSLCDKFQVAKIGDYIVTEQDKNYSILFIKDKKENIITFEEITIPISAINSKNISWQSYIDNQAQGHSSWMIFEISLTNGEVLECYSISQRSWLSFEDTEHFLSKFFCLPLKETPLEQRKRIGAPPQDSEIDRRAFWNPPLIMSGKKQEKPQYEVRHTKWALDGTLLSGSSIDMFFNAADPSYPFPIWLEVNNGHYGFKIRAFDTGKGLHSCYTREIPRRPPLIAGRFGFYKESIELPIKCPSYAKEFLVELVDFTDPDIVKIAVKHHLVPTDKKELYRIQLLKKDLSAVLKKGRRYRMAITPLNQSNFFIQTEESFVFN